MKTIKAPTVKKVIDASMSSPELRYNKHHYNKAKNFEIQRIANRIR